MALFGGPSTPVSRLEELKRLLQKDPTSRQFLALAEEYRRHGKYRDAVITLERGLQLHSTSVAAHVALGRTYQQLDRLEDAIRAFTNALRLDRENLVAIRQLAEVYLARGDKIEAIKKLKLYRGLKAGDRDVNEIIQKLEEEMSAAVAERPRSGVSRLFPTFPRLPRPSPHLHERDSPRPDDPAAGARRGTAFPAPAARDEAGPHGAHVRRRLEGARSARRGRAALRRAAAAAPPPRHLRRRSRTFSSRPLPPSPLPSEAPALSPFTAPIPSIREQPEPEKARSRSPRAKRSRTFRRRRRPPRSRSRWISTGRRRRRFPPAPSVETAPFDVPDARPEAPAEEPSRSSRRLSETSTAPRATWPMPARRIARSRRPPPTRRAPARCAKRPAALPPAERTDHPRLRRLARRFPKRPEATVDDLHGLLSNLVEGTEGIRAATLTDLARGFRS